MKKIRIIWCILSIAILLLITYNIINSMISYKYEIEKPFNVNKINTELAAGYLNSNIISLWYFFSYVGINIIFLLVSILYKRK
jgi:uncharacterized SAM-binding protein YcdF (DUF218 family)